MDDIVRHIRFNIDEISRLSKATLSLLRATDGSTSPIRYCSTLKNMLRIRAIWASHVRLSQQVYAFISVRDPGFQGCLAQLGAEQQRLAVDLKLLTPAGWPRSTQLGLNSLRVRAFHTLPTLMRELEREELTVLPLLQRWVYGGVTMHAAIIEREDNNRFDQAASA